MNLATINCIMKKNSIFLLLMLSLTFPALFAAEKNDGAPLGMNLEGGASYATPIFADVFKQTRWISQSGVGWEQGGPLDLDEYGWIKSFASAKHYAEAPIYEGSHTCIPKGNYTVLYDGEGVLEFGEVSVVSNQPGRIIINYPETKNGTAWLRIKSTNPDNYIRNIRVLSPGTEDTYQTQPFRQQLLDVWSDFKVIRFMDWLSTNGNPIVSWSERTTPQSYTQSGWGIAWEYIIQFSNMIECDPWICIPHLADDNYIRECAKLLKKDLNPNAKIYLEYSNEVWNTQFEQTRHAEREGVRLGYAAADRPWEGNRPYYVRRSMEIFKIFEEEFGGTDRFVRVLAWQTGGDLKGMMDFKYEIMKDEGMSSLVNKKGSDLVDAYATAPYFGGYLGGQLAWVNSHTVDDILTACENNLQDVMNTVDRQVKEAAAYGKIFLAYEAGQHLAGTGGNENNDDMTNKFIAANRHPRMKELYLNYMNRWKMSGAQTMCIFSSIGSPSKWGSWSIIESYCQDISEAPKYAAVREFSEENTPAWWLLPPPPPPVIGEAVINFDCSTLSGTLNMARDYVTTNQLDTLHFDTSDAGKVFDGGANTQATIYGGFIHIDRVNPKRKPEITKGNGFSIYMDAGNVNPPPAGVNQYSEGTGLFMWRADQFLQANPQGLSKLYINIRDYVDGKARFVVKNNGKYYMSEYSMTTKGEFELTEFDGSKMPTKRWLEVDLSDGDFGIDKFSSSELTGFQALTLDNVTEIGFWITSHRPLYGHTLSFMSFKAYAAVVAPEPGDYTPLATIIAECEALYEATEAGGGAGQYPTAAREVFKAAIDEAKDIYATPDLIGAEIGDAVADLEAARSAYLAAVTPPAHYYELLKEAIDAADALYNETEAGTDAGQYPTVARNIFKAAIDEAKALYTSPSLTEAEVGDAVADLNAAAEEYRKAVVIGVCSVAYARVKVYPNPVKDRLYFDAEAVPLAVRIFSTTGALLLASENVSEVDLSSLPQGVYLLQLVMSGESLMFNVLKE